MKYLIILLMSFLVSCSTNSFKNDLKKMNLAGNVKLIVETNHSGVEKFGEIEYDSAFTVKNVFSFDVDGMITEQTQYDASNLLAYKNKYEFSKEKNVSIITEYFGDGSLSGKRAVQYDANGNNLKSSKYDRDGYLAKGFWITSWKYDDRGNAIEESESDYNGNLKKEKIQKFNEEGNCVSSDEFLPEENSHVIWKYMYDIHKNPIKKLTHKSYNGFEILIQIEYEYDNFGNWVKRITKSNFGVSDSPVTIRRIQYY